MLWDIFFGHPVVLKAVQGSDVLTAINADQDDRSALPGLEVTEIIWQKCTNARDEDDSFNLTEHNISSQ